jgi:hypothetical protein
VLCTVFHRLHCTQLAMRSLQPADFFTSEAILRTCRHTQTVAKCVPCRWSILYLFVVREENKMYNILFISLSHVLLFYIKNFISCSWNCSWELWHSGARGQVHKISQIIWTKIKSCNIKKFFLHVKRAIFHIIFFYRTPIGQDIYPFNISCCNI